MRGKVSKARPFATRVVIFTPAAVIQYVRWVFSLPPQ